MPPFFYNYARSDGSLRKMRYSQMVLVNKIWSPDWVCGAYAMGTELYRRSGAPNDCQDGFRNYVESETVPKLTSLAIASDIPTSHSIMNGMSPGAILEERYILSHPRVHHTR